MGSTSTAYGRISRMLHWLVAVLVLVLSVSGIILANMNKGVPKSNMLQAHMIIGLLLVVLVGGRVIGRFVDQPPSPPAQLTAFRLVAFKAVHLFLYLSLVGLFVSGIAMAATYGTDKW